MNKCKLIILCLLIVLLTDIKFQIMKLTQRYCLIWLFMLFYTTNVFAQFEGYQNMYIDDFRYGLFVPPDYHPDTAHHLLLSVITLKKKPAM